jgi:diguanylate cyclase (GGDEF)-like protein/PAS domain S-box-containing protein
MRRTGAIQPFATRSRATVVAILAMFAVWTVMSITLSARATERARHRAVVVQVAARQRTLAERYVEDILLARQGAQANPDALAGVLRDSAHALLHGGTAPAVDGDDDDYTLTAASGSVIRSQLEQEQRLVTDLTNVGAAYLAGRSVDSVPLTAGEHLNVTDPLLRLRILAALTSNVALNTGRTIAGITDQQISETIRLQILLGVLGGLGALLLGWGLMVATRRQTAHFRSLVTSSTDLVLVFGAGGCRYASKSVADMVGRSETELLGSGFIDAVHPDDRAAVASACAEGGLHEITFLVSNRFGEWRHLEAHVTDLRDDRLIRGLVLNARDITERVRLEEELSHQAFHDGLTGLANRSLFRDRLEQALVRSARSGDPLAVLLVDLDGFKQVNDTLGHSSGDELLEELARRFGALTRSGDTLARLGGDEFAVLLDSAGEAEATKLAGRYIEQLNEVVTLGEHELSVNASIGIVVHTGGSCSGEELVRRADIAMYAAKRSGGAHCEVYRPEMAKAAGDLFGLEHNLREGLRRGEFVVHYQPEVDMATDRIVGVEALVRWHSATRGIVLPDQFIPAAEATDFILPLGEHVLQTACRQAAAWRADGLLAESFVMWVNLSGKQLSKAGVSRIVREALAASDLPARFLGLEITETALAVGGATGDRARAELEEIHALGVRIAIDDFGTGFSSLEQLRRFPIDVIKVERSFIQGVEKDPKSATITANVTSLAHALGLSTVAEGVETTGQLDSARELGCDLAQGYLFARPSPAADITLLLRSRRDMRPQDVPETVDRSEVGSATN